MSAFGGKADIAQTSDNVSPICPPRFPNMPTPEREWPRGDSEIAADAFEKIRMSAFGG